MFDLISISISNRLDRNRSFRLEDAGRIYPDDPFLSLCLGRIGWMGLSKYGQGPGRAGSTVPASSPSLGCVGVLWCVASASDQ